MPTITVQKDDLYQLAHLPATLDLTNLEARLALVKATAQVLHNGLAVLGVSAPQKM